MRIRNLLLRAWRVGWRVPVGCALVFVCVVPYVWLWASAFKYRVDMLASPPVLLFRPHLGNFVEVFWERRFDSNLTNSLIVALCSAALAAVVGLPAAYGLSRIQLRHKRQVLFLILSTRMAPPIALALPLYVIYREFGCLDTRAGLVLAHAAFSVSLFIWLMKGFFDGIPRSIDDVALTDGFSHLRTMLLLLRSVVPGLVVSCLFCALFSWNEFLLAMVLTGREAGTLPVSILGLVTPRGTYWGQVAAIALVATVPVVLLAAIARGYLVRAMTSGVLKA